MEKLIKKVKELANKGKKEKVIKKIFKSPDVPVRPIKLKIKYHVVK